VTAVVVVLVVVVALGLAAIFGPDSRDARFGLADRRRVGRNLSGLGLDADGLDADGLDASGVGWGGGLRRLPAARPVRGMSDGRSAGAEVWPAVSATGARRNQPGPLA